MSTMRIKALVEWVRTHAPAGRQLAHAALFEVSAIEEASKNLVEIWGYSGDGNPAEVLIREIAKEAP